MLFYLISSYLLTYFVNVTNAVAKPATTVFGHHHYHIRLIVTE